MKKKLKGEYFCFVFILLQIYMMSDEDDFDYTNTNRRSLDNKWTYVFPKTFVFNLSSGNLANIFHGGEPASTVPVASTTYAAPKQPKKGIFIIQKVDHVTGFFFQLKMLHQESWLQQLFKHFHSKFYFNKNILWWRSFQWCRSKMGTKRKNGCCVTING